MCHILIFVYSSCCVFLQEYYEFIESDHTDVFRKLGTFAWMGMAIAFAETLAAIKFGNGLFTQPWPKTVLWAWGTVATVFVVVFTTWSVRYYAAKDGKAGGRSKAKTKGMTAATRQPRGRRTAKID